MPAFSQHDVKPSERISRYIFRKDHFNPRTGRVRPPVFEPTRPKSEADSYKTSVYRTEGLSNGEIWAIGDDFVTKQHPEHLPSLARADTQIQNAVDADLKIDPDGVPHVRHANIIGWPDSDEARQIKRALLAQSAQLALRS
jgi:hypothetical protein